MLIKITRKITPSHVDTLSDRFQSGCQYQVDSTTGRLFIAEGWALPVLEQEPVLLASPVDAPSLKDAIAADTALDDAIAEAIERQGRPQQR
jgi:hypothetical protein